MLQLSKLSTTHIVVYRTLRNSYMQTKAIMKLNLQLRKAERKDLEIIVSLLANDTMASQREDTSTPLNKNYITAFEKIAEDSNQYLMVVENNNQIIGTFHMTLLPSLTYTGKSRLLIEAVRVHEKARSQGIGQWMIEQAIAFGKQHQVSMIQLTTDKQRDKAIAFYKQLGFKDSHEGMKYFLT